MNANFGIILLKSEREKFFSLSGRETRTWGDEIVEIGEEEYDCKLLKGVRFQMYPVTAFIKKKLGIELSSGDIEYAYMRGEGLDEYETWLRSNDEPETVGLHPFERGISELLSLLGPWAVMFAPAGDRLENLVSIDSAGLVDLVRRNVKSIPSSRGFLAVSP